VAEPSGTSVEVDVVTGGLLFVDVVFTGLDQLPVCGEETWSRAVATSPGGIANFAVALRRLGLSTSLAAAAGDDLWAPGAGMCSSARESSCPGHAVSPADPHH